MFCPECGSKNADDAVFCENCGANIAAALQQAQQEAPQTGTVQGAAQMPRYTSPTGTSPAAPAPGTYVSAPKKARKPLKTSTKVTLAAVAAVVVAGIVLFQVGQSQSSPDKVATDYFAALQAQDWNSAYQKLDVGSSEFLTEKNFESVQKQNTKDEKIASYEVSPAKLTDALTAGSFDKGSGALTKHVVIQYLMKGSSTPKRQTLSLVKQQGKKWLFFDSWKISTDNLVTSEVNISAPSDVTVSLGDIKLGSKYLVKDKDADEDSDKDDGNALVTYSVKKIFSGNYTVKATSPNIEDYTHSEDIDESDSEITINRSDLKLKQSVLDSVAKQPGDIIKALYTAALAGKDFSSVSSYFVTDRDHQQLLQDEYSEIKDEIAQGDKGGFKSIDFTSFNPEVDRSSSDMETIVVNTNVKYSYTAQPGTFFISNPAPYSGSDSSSFQMEFRNDKGKWLVDNMSDVDLSWQNGYSAN